MKKYIGPIVQGKENAGYARSCFARQLNYNADNPVMWAWFHVYMNGRSAWTAFTFDLTKGIVWG